MTLISWELESASYQTMCECLHDYVIKWKHFPHYWPFVRGIHQSQLNSPHKGQWCGALMFSSICAWRNGWVDNCEAGDLRHNRTQYDVIVMYQQGNVTCHGTWKQCSSSQSWGWVNWPGFNMVMPTGLLTTTWSSTSSSKISIYIVSNSNLNQMQLAWKCLVYWHVKVKFVSEGLCHVYQWFSMAASGTLKSISLLLLYWAEVADNRSLPASAQQCLTVSWLPYAVCSHCM